MTLAALYLFIATATAPIASPEIDEQLALLNNQIVTCATNGELDRQTASRLALLTAILRFTPSPDQKISALLNALILQVENAQRHGEVSQVCASQITGTANAIIALVG